MVYNQFRIDAEKLIKQIFAVLHCLNGVLILLRFFDVYYNRMLGDRHLRHIAQREHSVLLQLSCYARTDTPEVCQGFMPPKDSPETHLVQLRHTDAIFIRLHVLGHDVHSNLGKKEICSDPGCCRDACGIQHLADHPHGKLLG